MSRVSNVGAESIAPVAVWDRMVEQNIGNVGMLVLGKEKVAESGP